MNTRLRLRVAETVVSRGLWRPGERVAVAVSGGMDSVALLDLLVAGAGVHGATLSVATFDHGTRPGSDADAAFVRALGARLGLPVFAGRAALGEGASEAVCRRARYAWLDTLEVDHVALAHHRDDQAETAVLAWVRGAGTRGHAGMAWRRGRYVRPLLQTPRAALRAWAGGRGLTWREDPTNASLTPLRNQVRHTLLPQVEAMRPGAAAAIARAATHAAEDEALLSELARGAPWQHEACAWPRNWTVTTPSPVVRRALRDRLPDARSSHLDAILAAARSGRGRVWVSSSVCVVVTDAWVSIEGKAP